MIQNMGTKDKRVRIGIALIIALLFYFEMISGTLGYILLGLGIVLALTSFISFCPLYTLIGFSTKDKK